MENKKPTWRTELARERVSLLGTFNVTYERATERMKAKYPGNYIVEEYYDGKDHCFNLRLKFDTPEDETWFMLKNE